MAEGERATGTPNTIYDLSSVLFHALEGGASYDQYIRDAEEAGDEEIVDFFTRVRDEDSMRADEAQRLLAERTPIAGRPGGMTTGAMADTEPSGVPPLSEDVPPPATGETPPVAGQAPPRGEEGPLGRAERVDPLGREDRLPREERAALGREDRLPREERAALGREDPLSREERAALGREDPPPREERARETEREEDKGLIDKALDKLSGREDEERRREEERRER
jgi:hypothetical protein